MTRVGVLGGTFDPIHVGHLDVARAARTALSLTRVLVVPCHVPPHRALPVASAAHRFAMAALAVDDQEGLEMSDVELEASGPSFTSHTLDRLSAHGWPTASIVLITGADAFRDIESWKHYPHILDRCHFAVVSRPGHPAGAVRDALPALASRMVMAPSALPDRPAIVLIDEPTAEVSSTAIRARVRQHQPLDGLVPPAVARYIARHRLYAEGAA